MALCLDKAVEAELRAIPGNHTCVDCSARGPQWASVTFGVFMCLECSGAHRSLGVHISFVRSVAMDSWTKEQIQIMRLGGNQKCNSFLAKYNALAKKANGTGSDIYTKYNSPAACLYRDRLKAEMEGKPLPTELPQATGGASSSTEPINGETEEAYVKRQARLKEEAAERMRKKFGKSGGLGGQSGMAGLGSDSSYRPGAANSDLGFSVPSLSDLGISEDSTQKLQQEASKALESTWSFFGSAAAALGDAANVVAANVVETIDPNAQQNTSNNNFFPRDELKGKSSGKMVGIGGGGPPAGAARDERTKDEDNDQNLEWIASGAMDWWSKATSATSNLAQSLQGNSEAPEDVFSFRNNLKQKSTGQMSHVTSDEYTAPEAAAIRRSTSNNSTERLSTGSNSRSSSTGKMSSLAASESAGNLSGGLGSNHSSSERLNKVSPRMKKPADGDDDFFGSFGVGKDK
eukprot:GSChrysophyteH1.ASY1.ANO1.1885.1 assembled CDS